MRDEADVLQTIDAYADMLRRVCFVYTKNSHDTEDVFQDVFLKYALYKKPFTSDEHKKAWLIRVSINRCKDMLKAVGRKNRPLSELYDFPQPPDTRQREVFDAVLALPENFRTTVYLHYYEGYTAPEIAGILRKNPNTVYTWLARAREELKQTLGGEPDA